MIQAFKSNDYNMNLLDFATGGKWLKNKTACILRFVLNSVCILEFFCPKLGQVFKHSAAHPWYPNIVRVPLLPGFLKTRWLVVSEQENDSVIFQTNLFTNQSMFARKWDNWCERNVQIHVQSHRDTQQHGILTFIKLGLNKV